MKAQRCFIEIATLLLFCFVSAHADDTPYQWAASASDTRSQTTLGIADESVLSLRHYTSYGSIALEHWELKNFGTSDSAYAVDAYPHLWQGAYANIRYQQAQAATLYPDYSWRAEVFQNAGHGVELSASHDYLDFSSQVKINGVGFGYYWGNFYARLRYQQVDTLASSGNGARFIVRYYYRGDADHYLEVNTSQGRSDDFTNSLILTTHSNTQGAAWYHYLDTHWGLKASFSHSLDDSIYGGYQNSATLGLVYRW